MADKHESITLTSLEEEGIAVDAASKAQLNAQEAVVMNSDETDKKDDGQAPESAENGSGSEDSTMHPPGVHYDASSGLYFCDGSAALTREMIKAWHDESPKPTPEEIMIRMGRQTEAKRKENIRRVAGIKKKLHGGDDYDDDDDYVF